MKYTYELTDEQMQALKTMGITPVEEKETEVKKTSPFKRVGYGEKFYYIEAIGNVSPAEESCLYWDNEVYSAANYCTDKNLMKQRALHEALNRLLWRYSMEHDGDKIEYKSPKCRYYIFYSLTSKQWNTDCYNDWCAIGVPYFHTRKIANNAIKKIVKPFMEEHPEFTWEM